MNLVSPALQKRIRSFRFLRIDDEVYSSIVDFDDPVRRYVRNGYPNISPEGFGMVVQFWGNNQYKIVNRPNGMW